MILVLGEKNNISIRKVISYLKDFPFNRFNDLLPIHSFDLTKNSFNLSNFSSLNKYTTIWFYRSFLKLNDSFNLDKITGNEYKIFLDFILYANESNWIGSYHDFFYQNTLIQLSEAIKVGLKIPKTTISKKLPTGSKKLINKILGTTKEFSFKEHIYTSTGTQFIDKTNYKENSHLNLFQEYIEKQFEIRTVFIKGHMFSMAIFSQNDVKTKIDYRNYNKNTPNRNVPFKLPQKIKIKINTLFKNLNLNFGSIDMIYSINDEFVFLEINPGGQFDWVSTNCNYYIEKHLAKVLKK